MRKPILALSLIAALSAQADGDPDVLYQVSTIDALLSGVYDGTATVGEVVEHGGFGLGTFDALDGELILLDGVVYQAAFDGSVNQMPPSTETPFMAVTFFEPDQVLDAPESQDYATFKQWLEGELPSLNIAYAIKANARFADITYRSVPRQERPYPPLVEVTRQQAVFERKEIAGTLIGFWCPAFTKGINVPGFHLHFLSADHSQGGHVLDFTLDEAEVALDATNGWDVRLPMAKDYLEANLGSDRSRELHTVEQGASRDAPKGRSGEESRR